MEFPRDNYLYIGSFMRSVALAAGSIIILEILAGELLSRFILWFASFLAMMTSYTTWSRGILLTNSRANLWDIVFPLLMGIDEFCLFAILSPKYFLVDSINPLIWRWWLIVVGFHLLLAVGLVHNRIRNSSLLNDFEPEMQKLATEYHLWIRKDRKAAAAGAGLAFVFGCFALTMLPLWFQGACYFIIYDLLAVPFIFIFAYACWRSDQQRQRIDEYVFTLRSSNDQRGG
jgi:membrane protein insertase Oxa1/YidC/SpoIIIJ